MLTPFDLQVRFTDPCLQFQLICEGCPHDGPKGGAPWTCKHCYYEHPDPVGDPFYQSTVKKLMFFCATILLFVRTLLSSSVTTLINPTSVVSHRPLVFLEDSRLANLAKSATTHASVR